MRPGNAKGVSLSLFSISLNHALYFSLLLSTRDDAQGEWAASYWHTWTYSNVPQSNSDQDGWDEHTYLFLYLGQAHNGTTVCWIIDTLNHILSQEHIIIRWHDRAFCCVSLFHSLTHTHKQPIQYTKKPLRKRKTEISDTYDSQTSTHLSPLAWSLIQNVGNFEYILRCQ